MKRRFHRILTRSNRGFMAFWPIPGTPVMVLAGLEWPEPGAQAHAVRP
jgi:hypothetical protein